jgi:hypothetical protein
LLLEVHTCAELLQLQVERLYEYRLGRFQLVGLIGRYKDLQTIIVRRCAKTKGIFCRDSLPGRPQPRAPLERRRLSSAIGFPTRVSIVVSCRLEDTHFQALLERAPLVRDAKQDEREVKYQALSDRGKKTIRW